MHPVVLAAFILSGISSLTLEIIWTRMLEHVFGATTLAIATVLTCFMGGLALGSWLFGRFADKIKSPLRAYAVAEGVVGLCAFALPLLIEHVYPGLNKMLVAHAGNSFWQFSLLRFLAVAVALLIPTTCMGATLPLLARHVISSEAQMLRVGSRVGILYTLNTAGAIGGVFLATFALLPLIGLSATNKVAGTVNIVLCLTLLLFRRWLEPRSAPAVPVDADMEIAVAVEGARSFDATPAQRLVAVVAFFLSGMAAMNLQVVWNRAMALVIGSSVYSFALVLLAFLVGLAIGSALLSGASKRLKNPVIALAVVELFIAVCAMANYLYMDDLPRIFAVLTTTHIEAYEDHVGLVQFIMFTVAALAALPATVGMGATFPLTIRIVTKGLKSVGKDVGSVYAMNTFGAICGSFLSAFVFVPLFSRYLGGAGMQTTFFLSVTVYTVLGLALLAVTRGLRLARVLLAAPAVLLTAAFLFGAPGWDPAAMTIGVFRISLMENALDEESWGDPDVKYYYDGVTTTVSIELWGRHFALKNNGKVDASNGDDMPTQIMIAAYPLMFHPAGPEDLDVAIIGFGSGVTVGAALQFPVKQVDVVELENAVIEASTVFGLMEGEEPDPELDVNHLIYRRPTVSATGEPNPDYDWTDPDTYVIDDRVRIVNDDGRNYLASTDKKYDVIVSEPSNPWITGVSNMFTVDSFQSSAKALKPHGIFAQWVQLYEMSPKNIKTIFRTFASVYPYVVLFAAEDLSSDTVLLGSFEPIEFDLGRVARALENETVATELERAYIFAPTDVFARVLLVSKDELLRYTNGPDEETWPDQLINTDDNAAIEFSAPHDMISFRKFAGYLATIYTDEWTFGRLHDVVTNTGSGDQLARDLAEQALSLLMNGRKREANRFLVSAAEVDADEPTVVLAAQIAELLTGRGGAPPPEIEPVTPSATMTASQVEELERHLDGIRRSLDLTAHHDALERFGRVPDHLWRRGGPQMMLLKGYLHFVNGDPSDSTECEEAIEILSQLVREHEGYVIGHPEIHFYLGLCHDNALHFDKAVKNVRFYVEMTRRREAHAAIAVAQAQANLEAVLVGLNGTMPIELPADAPSAPTTDRQGESPKDNHSEL